MAAHCHGAAGLVPGFVRAGLLVPARRTHAVRKARHTRTRVRVHRRQALRLRITLRACREAARTARGLRALGAVLARLAGALIDVAAGLTIASPAQLALARVTSRSQVMARAVQRIAVVLAAHALLDRFLAVLTIEASRTLARPAARKISN